MAPQAKVTPAQDAKIAAQDKAAKPWGHVDNPIPAESLDTTDSVEAAGIVSAVWNPEKRTMTLEVAFGWERELVGRGKTGSKEPKARERHADSFKNNGYVHVRYPNGRIERVILGVNAMTGDLTPTAEEKASWTERGVRQEKTLRDLYGSA